MIEPTFAAMRPRHTVLICDDRPELRAAISMALNVQPQFEVVGEAVDRATCLARVLQTTPDILILDIGMPGGGTHVATDAKALQPDLQIVVFSAINDPHVQRAMIDAGADDYVLKTGRLRPLLDALNRAADTRHHQMMT